MLQLALSIAMDASSLYTLPISMHLLRLSFSLGGKAFCLALAVLD